MGKRFSTSITPEVQKVTVGGWVKSVRDLGSIVFVILNDREGSLQLTFKEGDVPTDMLETAKELTHSSAVMAKGKVREANNDYGFEIIPETLTVNKAEAPLPVDIFKGTSGLRQRIKWRMLDLRGKDRAIFRVRALISKAFEDFLLARDFVRIDTPVLSPYATEGGADVFKVKYFDRESYLRQSPQLYKQLMAASLEKVFEIGPAFRAEPSHTTRHLTEFTSLDLEMAWIEGIGELLDLAEEMFKHIFQFLTNEGRQFFNALEKAPPRVPRPPFPRITFQEARSFLKEHGIKLEGKEISPEGEKILGQIANDKHNSDFLWITEYPWDVRPFYHMRKGKTLTKSFDLLYRGEEIITGSQREHRFDILKQQMIEKGLAPETFGYYLKSFKFGMPPHGGYACGLARLTALVLKLDNIREATLFPRDPETLEP